MSRVVTFRQLPLIPKLHGADATVDLRAVPRRAVRSSPMSARGSMQALNLSVLFRSMLGVPEPALSPSSLLDPAPTCLGARDQGGGAAEAWPHHDGRGHKPHSMCHGYKAQRLQVVIWSLRGLLWLKSELLSQTQLGSGLHLGT